MKFYYYDSTKKVINHCYYDEDKESESRGLPFFELTIEEWSKTLGCMPLGKSYFYKDGELSLEDDEEIINSDEYKRESITNEINTYQRYLSDTDYIVTKLNEAKIEDEDEFESLRTEYTDQLAKRKEARKKINELEEELKKLK